MEIATNTLDVKWIQGDYLSWNLNMWIDEVASYVKNSNYLSFKI